MRLQNIWISKYKNLSDFNVAFNGNSHIEVFVGKNGTGKSNLFEACIDIFSHLYRFDNRRERPNINFQYRIKYEIENSVTEIEWKDDVLKINGASKSKVVGTPLPDNILIYYSGHNSRVDESSISFQSLLRKHFRGGKTVDFHRFVFFDRAYKKLLIALFLIQPFDENISNTVKEKLGIQNIDKEFIITLKRPFIVRRNFKVDRADDNTLYWGIKGQAREFLRRLATCDTPLDEKAGMRKSGYITDEYKPYYKYYINIDKFKTEFKGETVDKLIEMFNSIKVIDIIQDIKLNISLMNGQTQDISHFSDGQFQSIYLFSLLESFQDKNCLTLMDEPDSFLHPEWQYEFLNQTKQISEPAKRKNQVLLSSHSPSTVAAFDQDKLVNFTIVNNNIKAGSANKCDIIGTLSAGLMKYSENEIVMSINTYLQNTNHPVLFTEGLSDEYILAIAWEKLYGSASRPFCIHGAFDRNFLSNMFSRDEVKKVYSARPLFALFDFDEAYNNWNGLKKEADEVVNPALGMTKKLLDAKHYAMLLPVPANPIISKQVLNPNNGKTYEGNSLLTIELLFHDDPQIADHFAVDVERTDGFIKFTGDKVKFAKEIVPKIEAARFEVFRPMFEFIMSKC